MFAFHRALLFKRASCNGLTEIDNILSGAWVHHPPVHRLWLSQPRPVVQEHAQHAACQHAIKSAIGYCA
jgi:hypothetical protein